MVRQIKVVGSPVKHRYSATQSGKFDTFGYIIEDVYCVLCTVLPERQEPDSVDEELHLVSCEQIVV